MWNKQHLMNRYKNQWTYMLLTILFNLAEGQISVQLTISTGFADKFGQVSRPAFCSDNSVPASSKIICCSSVFREAMGASASYGSHHSHVPNTLRLLIWHFQANDSYTCPAQNWLELNSLKAVHKWAIWWSRRKALQHECASHKKWGQSWHSKL